MLNNNNFTIMSVDQFPIITMQVFPETLEHANNWIAEMDLVLDQKQNFVLVYPPINKKNEQEDMEGMKAVRRWLKTGKMPLSQYCAGMIMTVNQQTNDKEQLMQLSPVVSAVYGVPIFVEETLDGAYAQANKLLGNK